MTHTHLKYGILRWGNAWKTVINNLNKMHSKVLDIMKKKEEKESIYCLTTKKLNSQIISIVKDMLKVEV